jgi:SEC-C motif
MNLLDRDAGYRAPMSLIDAGWAAWLPEELAVAHRAAGGGSANRRDLRNLLAAEPDAARRERWERFALACPSRIDLPAEPDGLTEEEAYALLADLGLVAGTPPRPVASPEAVELVLTLDHDEVRELEQVRSARFDGPTATTPVDALPSLDASFGSGVGRNDPCPCGSGKKFKRCHGA